MQLFSIKYYYDDGVKTSMRRAIICAKNEREAENILICQEESIYDTFVDIINTTKFDLDESKIILIQKE